MKWCKFNKLKNRRVRKGKRLYNPYQPPRTIGEQEFQTWLLTGWFWKFMGMGERK